MLPRIGQVDKLYLNATMSLNRKIGIFQPGLYEILGHHKSISILSMCTYQTYKFKGDFCTGLLPQVEYKRKKKWKTPNKLSRKVFHHLSYC